MSVMWETVGWVLFLAGGIFGVFGTVMAVGQGNLPMVPVTLLVGTGLIMAGAWAGSRGQ